jgi:hypothetical protein
MFEDVGDIALIGLHSDFSNLGILNIRHLVYFIKCHILSQTDLSWMSSKTYMRQWQ